MTNEALERARLRRTTFGKALRQWRKRRGHSQMSLASEIGGSARHLCFLENGRARPSREIVLALARVLELPLRERNDLLEAAGFAREFRESGLDALDLAPVAKAIDLLLERQEPFPAILVDRHWNLTRANRGARRLFTWLGGGAPPAEPNVLRALFDPDGLRPYVASWELVAPTLLDRVRLEAVGGILDGPMRGLLEDLEALPGVPERGARTLPGVPGPLVPVTFARDGLELSFFSALTTLGTPRDVTLQELRLEHFFPADAGTAERFGRLPEA